MLNSAAFLLFGSTRGQTIPRFFFVRRRQVPLVCWHRRNPRSTEIRSFYLSTMLRTDAPLSPTTKVIDNARNFSLLRIYDTHVNNSTCVRIDTGCAQGHWTTLSWLFEATPPVFRPFFYVTTAPFEFSKFIYNLLSLFFFFLLIYILVNY